MKSSAKNISLNSYDDIFSTEETREDAKREKIMDMPLSELHPFPDHPFQVRDDDAMKETVESIKEYGVLVPAIVRPRADGGYDNAREFLLRYKYSSGSPVTASLTGVTWKDSDENQARLYMNEAVALINQEWSGNGITASFRTDTSCLYQDDYYDGFHYSFRGILNLHVTDAATEDAKAVLKDMGVSYQEGQSDYSVDFEGKVSCSSSTVVLTGGYLLTENQ